MKFKRFISQPPISPYAPTWDFRVGTSKCDDIDVTSLSQFLLSKENEIKKLPSSVAGNGKMSDGNTGLGSNSTTSKFQHYNLLTWSHPEIKKLKSNIVKNLFKYNDECGNNNPREVYVQCWYNILRFGQKINPHSHSATGKCYLSGHFNVQVNDTSTCYMSPINQLNYPDVYDVKNKDGDMTLFPSYIFHYTTPHYSFKPRITIAFDLNLYKMHDNFIPL